MSRASLPIERQAAREGRALFCAKDGTDCCCGEGEDPGEPPANCNDCADCASSYLVKWTGLIWSKTEYCFEDDATYVYTKKYDMEAIVYRDGAADSCSYGPPPGDEYTGTITTTRQVWTNCPADGPGCGTGVTVTPCYATLTCNSSVSTTGMQLTFLTKLPEPDCAALVYPFQYVFSPTARIVIYSRGHLAGACWPSFVPVDYGMGFEDSVVSYGTIEIA